MTVKRLAKTSAARKKVAMMPFRSEMNSVLDAELGVGIVDLGLIYQVKKSAGGRVKVIMSLTSMGCPMGPQITGEIRRTLLMQKAVREVEVEIVWDPPWNPSMMNPEVKAILFGNDHAHSDQYKTQQ